MKKLFLLAVLVTMIFSGSVFADPGNGNGNGGGKAHSILMTNASGSMNFQSGNIVYGWDETPWLYMNSSAGISGDWYRHQEPTYLFDSTNLTTNFNYFSNSNGTWISPKNWTAIKEDGEWHIHSNVVGDNNGYSVNFKVVPEPISAGLFILGGGALALIRRKQKKA